MGIFLAWLDMKPKERLTDSHLRSTDEELFQRKCLAVGSAEEREW
jgi:hypothetical protein